MKALRVLALVAFVFAIFGAPVLAQELTSEQKFDVEKIKAVSPTSVTLSGAGLGAGLGAALTIVGAGYGFGKIGAAALESMSRQPEVAGRIQTAMIILAALLEGVTLFALVVCIQVAGAAKF